MTMTPEEVRKACLADARVAMELVLDSAEQLLEGLDLLADVSRYNIFDGINHSPWYVAHKAINDATRTRRDLRSILERLADVHEQIIKEDA